MTAKSQKAYIDIVNELPQRRLEVFKALKSITSSQRTIETVCNLLGKEKHQISGRLTELQDMGLITEINPSGRYTIYTIVNPQHVAYFQAEREKDKFKNDTRNYIKKWELKLDPTTILNLSQYVG